MATKRKALAAPLIDDDGQTMTVDDGPNPAAGDFLRRVSLAEAHVESALKQIADAKQSLKVAKECYDEAVDRLRKIVRDEAEGLPLFDGPES